MQDVSDESVAHEGGKARGRVSAAVAEEERARATYLVAGAALVGAVFLYLQFRTPAILDVDGYYHIKWSRLLWDGLRQGIFPAPFPYLPLTTLNPRDYVDHHLLFHLFLIPFTWFGDLRLGAKVAAVLFGSLGVLSGYWLMIRYRLRYVPLWLLALLACSAPFLYRLSMTRAQTLSIVFLVVGIGLLFEGRYRWLAPLAFLYVWYYSLFVLLGAAAVIWAAAIFWSERRLEWRPVVWAGVGTLAGFIINPYFPQNITLFLSHVFMKVKADEFSTSVGAEWYPYDSWYFMGSCAVAFVSMVIGYLAFQWEERRRSARALFFLLFSTMLLVANARSRRFVEYWPPFAVLFAAFSLQAFWDGARAFASRLPSEVMDDLEPFLDRGDRPAETTRRRDEVWHEPEALGVGLGLALLVYLVTAWVVTQRVAGGVVAALLVAAGLGGYYRFRGWRKMAVALVALALAIPLYLNVRETGHTIRSEQRPDAYRGGAEWLRANAPKGELVFNTDWDDFPKLFFYDSDHVYASGLDPTYLLEANRDLSKLYEDITLGREENAAELIRDRFGARYVFTDNEEVHIDFQSKAVDSGWFEIVYTDDHCTVLRLRDERRESAGEQPAEESEDEPLSPAEEETGGPPQ